MGPASRVAPVDKPSLAVTLILAAVVLGERITFRVAGGVALMIIVPSSSFDDQGGWAYTLGDRRYQTIRAGGVR
jgi:hypothetical protein